MRIAMGQAWPKHPVGVLVVGLDNSGKTTVINWLAGSTLTPAPDADKLSLPLPTIGFTARRFTLEKTPVTVLDMSGQGRYRNLWTYYLRQIDGILFVVDVSNKYRVPVALMELQRLLNQTMLRRHRPCLPLLVLVNKTDRPTATIERVNRVVDELRRACFMTRRPCHVIASSALNGNGLRRGFDWLRKQIGKKRQLQRKVGPTWLY